MQTGAAYVRVSTEDQIEFSPDSQIKKIREYAGNHDILLPGEYIFLDEGISGRTAEKRPAFMKMIAAAKARPRPFDVILVWKFSRFARNRQDSILYKSMLRKECGIDVVSITEQLSGDPTAILIEALLEAMDEYYSINLAQEVKRGMNEKFSRGGVVSVPPFGYSMGEDRFEINEEQASFVRGMFQAYADGMTCRQIAVWLNERGVRTARGNLFENRTVEYILSNPTYLGKLRRKVEETSGRGESYCYCGEKMAVVDGKHEPIIDQKTFDMVQERITKTKEMYPAYARITHTGFMLRGLVRCSGCGGTLTLAEKGKALQCHRYARGQCRESHHIRLEKINRAVLAKISKDLFKETEDNNFIEVRIHGRKAELFADDVGWLLEREYKRLKRIKAAYEDGIDSLEEYRKKKSEILSRIGELENEKGQPGKIGIETIKDSLGEQQKSEEDDSQKNVKAVRVHPGDIIDVLNSHEISEDTKNLLLRSFVSKIVFDRAAGNIQIYYHL